MTTAEVAQDSIQEALKIAQMNLEYSIKQYRETIESMEKAVGYLNNPNLAAINLEVSTVQHQTRQLVVACSDWKEKVNVVKALLFASGAVVAESLCMFCGSMVDVWATGLCAKCTKTVCDNEEEDRKLDEKKVVSCRCGYGPVDQNDLDEHEYQMGRVDGESGRHGRK